VFFELARRERPLLALDRAVSGVAQERIRQVQDDLDATVGEDLLGRGRSVARAGQEPEAVDVPAEAAVGTDFEIAHRPSLTPPVKNRRRFPAAAPIANLACTYLPARSAGRVDPMIVLRES
jgi:hypothetical protein